MAQQQPDAGRLLREQPKPPPQPVAPPAAPEQPASPEITDTGLRILVRGFRIEGATLIPAAELAEQIKDRVGKEASFADLRAAARTLVRYYAARGFSARVILPEQDVREGVITLRVIEGRRGSLRIEKDGERLDAARIERFIERRLPAGAVMDLDALGEALALVNELPGVSARSVLAAGRREGEVDVTVRAEQTPPRNYSVQVNNQGSRGSGTVQASFGAQLVNPTGAFDAASALINRSEGTTFARGEYGVALGESGLRVGANASRLTYHLTQSNFRALAAKGTAQTLGASAAYPLSARPELDLRLSGGIERRELVDRTISGETGNRVVEAANFGATVAFPDALLGGGSSFAEARLVVGKTRQRNATALATDRATRDVEGGYAKVEYSLDRLHDLAPLWLLGFSLRGQRAGNNLDSSERMGLGGQNGVRAYPTGEALGDHALVLALSLSHQVSDTVTTSLFLDHGRVRLNHRLWNNWNATNPSLPNRYSLSGIGVGLSWEIVPGASLGVSIAWRIGDNPGRDAAGNDSDGSRPGPRGWVSFVARF